MHSTIQATGRQNSAARLRATSRGFTLVELLITVAIISILAGLLLGVAARAGERGREARTKAMIARLHTLVMEHYDTYRDRRAPVSDSVETAINSISDSRVRNLARAEARLYALRELMLLEMPDRWSDVVIKAIENVNSSSDLVAPLYLKSTSSSTYLGPTPLNEAYRRQYFSMVEAGVSKEDIHDNAGAECLYMIVMLATADGEARTLFNESSIGDTDGDGAREFLDGWGNPISFLRWAPGFDSDLQANANSLVNRMDQRWLDQASADHDPFDVFRSENWAFRLTPVIFSPGSDERYDIVTATGTTLWPSAVTTTTAYGTRRLDPYTPIPTASTDLYLGTAVDDGAADNITNHNITSE